MRAESFTNSSLSSARRCLQQHRLRYDLRLERDRDEDREPLLIGNLWHAAHDLQFQGGDPFKLIDEKAPSRLWAVKLRRLFAAYGWYWQKQPLEILAAEERFLVQHAGERYQGRKDARIRIDGRVGMLERKTTSEGLEGTSSYWDRLRMDTQTGFYALSEETRPAFILYDVVRKPTIIPKRLTKAEVARMQKELAKHGGANYFEILGPDEIEEALSLGHETPELYGARLTSDIGNRPDFYFARREVHRTNADYRTLIRNVEAEARVIRFAQDSGAIFRNPDACTALGTCEFFGLCSNNVAPADDEIPAGFRRRKHLHPELADD
jgi:hypothetical protein